VAAVILAGCGGTEVAGKGAPASPTPSASTASASPTPSDNGVAALSAEQILGKAKAALKSADAVRIKGTAGAGADRIDIDMRYTATSAQGTLASAGQPIAIKRIGNTVYIKGSRGFWKSTVPPAAVELLTGKWLKGPITDQRLAGLSELTDLSKAADGILEPDGKITKGEKETVAGTPAIALLSSGKDGGKLYIATTGEPYPLQIAPTKATDAGQIDFTEYGKKTAVSPPPAELVIDVSKLGN
jgi:hypothetical protein